MKEWEPQTKTRSWILVGILIIISGCSTRYYRNAADKEVYKTIQEFEQRIFGHTNSFSIDTVYSSRDPDSIKAEEILKDRMSQGSRKLTLEEALDLAAKSRRYQNQKEQLYLTALNVTEARYMFESHFFFGSSATFSRDPTGAERGSINTEAGINRTLKTGGRIGVTLANDLLRYFTGDPRRSIVNVVSINLMQPILRGGGRYSQAVESLTQAERNLIYALRNYYHFQNEFAVEIVSDYFSLLAQKAIVRNNYTNYLRRVETTKYLEARSVDRVSANAVDEARQAELSARIAYINSVASYLSALDAFKLKLDIPLGEQIFLDDSVLEELEQIGLIELNIDRETAFKFAIERHPTILNEIDRFEDSKRKLKVAANALKAELNLIGGASISSERPTDYTNFDIDKIQYNVGLELNLPLDRLRERNAYRTALINFEAQLRNLAYVLDQHKDRLDRGLRDLEQRRLNYLNRLAALKVAERRVEMNQILLEAGRVQIRDLREAQDALIQVQNDLTLTAVSYLEARLQLLLNMGLVDASKPKYWLADPIKEMGILIAGKDTGFRMPDDQVISPDRYLEMP